MKQIKPFLLLSCLLISAIVLSGCWNYREVESMGIVTGIAVDKKYDKYLITTEVVVFAGGKSNQISTTLLSSEGNTMFDALRNMIRIAGKKLYYSHAKIVIISKEIAEEGIIPILDWINRDNEPRDDLDLLVSNKSSARDILEMKSITSEVLSFEMRDMILAEKQLSNALDVKVWQFTRDLSAMGINNTVPTVDSTIVNNKLVPEITGTGVFKEDRLVGFLSGEETKTMMFIKNKIKGGLLTFREHDDNSQTNITLEIFNNKTTLKPHYADGKITIEINTSTDVAIAENGGRYNYIDEAGQKKLKEDFEAILENRIKFLVKKVQEQYGSDIFGFGKTIKINIPNLWKQIEPQWEQLYKDVHVEVHSIINIKNSALHSKPIQVGE